ncbi:hypothetical protein BKA60DRAFT_599656 [Fusarium oxysporum]|nr:hypothetical protein BKA60DRAFT_599656 [Fusarium oxysporum]
MEVTGLAVGVVGLAGLFSVCLDSLSRFQSYRESNSETHVLYTRFRAARARFEQWGVSVGISNGRLQPNHHDRLDNKKTADLIEDILQIIAKTICKESILRGTRTGSRLQSGQLGGQSQSRGKRIKWAFGGKESRNEQADDFEKLVQQLYNLIPPEDKSQSYEGLESEAWVEDIRQMLAKIEEGIKCKSCDLTLSSIVRLTESWLSPVDSTKPSVLWINGPAGFGKTVLSAHIVHHLSDALDTPVAHFFFTSDDESREDPFSALRSWLYQIAAKNDDAFQCVHRTWENDPSEKASRRTLVDLFKQVVKAVPGCLFIADGLDECSQLSNGDASVARFLRDITNTIAGFDIRFLLVSRDEPEIREALEENEEILSEYRIGTDDVEADTAAFSQSVVDKKLSNKSKGLRSVISEAMTVRCQGQFLWIKMQEESLRNGMSKKRLHEVVENMPSGLHHLYNRNWNRIMNMSDWDRDRTFALLRLTAFTFRPLTVYTVTEAVLITQFQELDPDEYPESVNDEYIRTEIIGLCGPLLEVHDHPQHSSPGNRTLHIPHFSVRQYLVENLPAPAWMQANDVLNKKYESLHHTAIARACVQYLTFLVYAAHNWMHHARLGLMDPSLLELSKGFLLQDKAQFKSLINYLADPEDISLAKKSVFQPQLRPFEYVLYGGWINMADHLIDDADVNEIGALGRSPIFSACHSGSAETVNLLIRRGADLSITDSLGLTCLHLATACGFENIVRILVESKVELSPQDHTGRTPLHLASTRGHIKCYQYLLQRGADVNIRDKWGGNVVHYACIHGQAELLRFILRNAPDNFATDHYCRLGSPLIVASHYGDVYMAKLLFEHGAVSSLFITDTLGNLPLHYAASYGHAELLELFLEHGGERTLSVSNAAGITALHLACGARERDRIISLLLRPGVEQSLLTGDEEGDTPLYVASAAGYASYVKLILQYSEPEHQRLLEMRNRNLETPLFVASYNGHTEVVKTLLEHGAETTLHVLNSHNISPLWAASFNGSSKITITTAGLGGETPLHAATTENHAEVLKFLLEVPAVPVNQKTTYGFTALFIASRNGYHDMVDESWLGLSPLFTAVANGHLEVAKLLLSKGAHLQPWEALISTASGSCSPLLGPFTNLEPLSRDAETLDFTPGAFWCYVCTLGVRDDQEFHCVECSDSYMFLCPECFSRGFQLCPRLHVLVPFQSDESDSQSNEDGSIDSKDS